MGKHPTNPTTKSHSRSYIAAEPLLLQEFASKIRESHLDAVAVTVIHVQELRVVRRYHIPGRLVGPQFELVARMQPLALPAHKSSSTVSLTLTTVAGRPCGLCASHCFTDQRCDMLGVRSAFSHVPACACMAQCMQAAVQACSVKAAQGRHNTTVPWQLFQQGDCLMQPAGTLTCGRGPRSPAPPPSSRSGG